MKAWIYQDAHQVKERGADAASWYVGWIDPEGKRRCQSCGPGSDGARNAAKKKRKVEAELLTGTYQSNTRKTWEDFRKEYEAKVLEGRKATSLRLIEDALNRFEKIIKPKRIAAVKTQTIDEFKAKRRLERGKKKGELLSKASINKELRHLRAALRKANKWGYLPMVPDIAFEKEPKSLPTYVSPAHFAAIYKACSGAKRPHYLPFSAADWWRGLLVMAYMTGWRISELLSLRREDLDLDKGEAITRAEDNKGGREEKIKLHPVVVAHLKKLVSFEPMVFSWKWNDRALLDEFARIQESAGVKLPCRGNHEHTRYCHVYGFHDLRRAFATMNADRLTATALQTLMRHKSFATTLGYINMARQLDSAVAALHVPDVLTVETA